MHTSTTGQDLILVISTFDDLQACQSICGQLIAEKVIAGANILPGVETLYSDGTGPIKSVETVAIMRTTEGAIPILSRYVSEGKITDVSILRTQQLVTTYATWIRENTQGIS